MKLRWYDRILVSLSGLVLIALGVLVALVGCGTIEWPANLSVDMVQSGWRWTPVFLIAAVLVVLWGIRLVIRPFLRGFGKHSDAVAVATSAEGDNMMLSTQALDYLVRRCVNRSADIPAASIRIRSRKEGLEVGLRATVSADACIPKAVSALQKDVRDTLTHQAGVNVNSVRVFVDSTRETARSRKNVRLLPPAEEDMGLPELIMRTRNEEPKTEPTETPVKPAEEKHEEEVKTASAEVKTEAEVPAEKADGTKTASEEISAEKLSGESGENAAAIPSVEENAENAAAAEESDSPVKGISKNAFPFPEE